MFHRPEARWFCYPETQRGALCLLTGQLLNSIGLGGDALDAVIGGEVLGPEGIIITQGDEPLTTQGQHEQPPTIGISGPQTHLDGEGGDRPEAAIVPIFGKEVRKPPLLVALGPRATGSTGR